jgi:hypothetical protein
MFAYAEVDGEVADLRDAITGKDGFGEQNQWTVESRPKRSRLVRCDRSGAGRARGRIQLQPIRSARMNPEIDPVMLAHLLWRPEVLELLSRVGYAPKQFRGPRKQLYEVLCKAMTLREITAAIHEFMGRRQAWRGHPAHA